MTSDIRSDWPWITNLFQQGIVTTGFYSFATVNDDGSAHVTPIASLVLGDDCSGYFSDVFPASMAQNLKRDQRVCIMAVRMGFWYWLRALISGRFEGWPGVRLYGTVGERRKSRPGEVERWRKRVRRFKHLKGYKLLWKNVDIVRDITFTHYEPVRAGAMTRHLAMQLGGLNPEI
jgi:uncharacterized protein